MQISISNFQSIEKSKLDFSGFAVVTGESNLGKSAIIRAVSALTFGLPGDYYVRRGASVAAVGVKFDDNLVVKWQKVPTSKKAPGRETLLDINGVRHTKLGRDHFSLLEPLGLISIDSPSGDVRPQIAKQFDKAFLLDLPESVVAEVFRTLGRGDVVASARDAARKDLMKNKSEHKVRDGDVPPLQNSVAERNWVRPLATEVRVTLSKLESVIPLDSLLTKVSELLAEKFPDQVPHVPALKDLSRELKVLQGIDQHLDIQVPLIPKIPVDLNLALLEKLNENLSQGDQINTTLQGIEVDLGNSRAALLKMEEELGVCPTCGSSFDKHAKEAHDL